MSHYHYQGRSPQYYSANAGPQPIDCRGDDIQTCYRTAAAPPVNPSGYPVSCRGHSVYGTARQWSCPTEITTEVLRAADGKLYRRSVQIFFINELGEFLALTPIGRNNNNFRQTVQGGIERGETPFDAAERETREEIGIQLGFHNSGVLHCGAEFVCKILPPQIGDDNAPEGKRNEAGEVVDESRADFRYLSKTWRKLNVAGQELYPMLAFMHSSTIESVRLVPEDPNNHEFCRVEWMPLSALVDMSCGRKRVVMKRIVSLVCHAARKFLIERQYPTDMLRSVEESDYFQRWDTLNNNRKMEDVLSAQ